MSGTKLTFCIGYRNRYLHLLETFPKNIDLVRSFSDVDIVFLQYGYSDKNEDNAVYWLYENYKEDIDKGTLTVFETIEPKYWNMSHSKNCTHRLASGEFVCNLDVDNYIGKEFMDFSYNTIDNEDMDKYFIRKRGRGQGGRLLVKKDIFFDLRGYDERMDGGWGHEDGDFHERLERVGMKRLRPPEFPFIDHTLKERTQEIRLDYNLSKEKHDRIRTGNRLNGLTKVNPSGFGKGVFFRNLNPEDVIEIL